MKKTLTFLICLIVSGVTALQAQTYDFAGNKIDTTNWQKNYQIIGDSIKVKLKFEGKTFKSFLRCEHIVIGDIDSYVLSKNSSLPSDNKSIDFYSQLAAGPVTMSGKVFNDKGKKILKFKEDILVVAFSDNYGKGFTIYPKIKVE